MRRFAQTKRIVDFSMRGSDLRKRGEILNAGRKVERMRKISFEQVLRGW